VVVVVGEPKGVLILLPNVLMPNRKEVSVVVEVVEVVEVD